jgi:hypothetical protein
MAKPKKGSVINPLMLIAAKNKPDQESVDKIHMVVLTALDAAKRGKCPNGLANTLSEHLLVGVLMWSKMGNRPLYDRAVTAWTAMGKACQRPTDLLDLTTSEYQSIRRAMQHYLRAIPHLEIGQLAGAFLEAQKKLGYTTMEAV